MIFNVDSLKSVLLIDISMNNYTNVIFNILLKYDSILPEGIRNAYYIYKYKEFEHQYMKKFFRIISIVENQEKYDYSIEDISYDIMDSFEKNIKEDFNTIENILKDFLEPDTNDPDNIFLLRKMQMNSIILQLANRMNEIYNQKKDSMIKQMFDINTRIIGKIDDRKNKKEYQCKELDIAIKNLIKKIKSYKYESSIKMENL